MWTTAYSSWTGKSLYLEDVYVDPSVRQRGIGSSLIRIGAAAAEACRSDRIQWVVLNWNKGAQRCDERLGSTPLTEWTLHRLEEENLSSCGSGTGPVVK